jgi:exosortase A-associated hydrolase 2
VAGADPPDSVRAQEQAFFFDHQGVRLFALAHPSPCPRRTGWVFCHPYGEEKQFTYRILARFARRMAQEGFPVLRFDGRGYGDSEGELEDSTVATQVEETLAAADQARERLGVDRLGLLGLRFGATVAALAAERRSDVDALVLWSPIVKGTSYLDALLRKKLFAQMAHGRGSLRRDDLLRELGETGRIEFEGHYLTREMANGIAAVDLPAVVAGREREVLVSCVRNRRGRYGDFEALVTTYQEKGARCSLEFAEDSEYWDMGAMNLWQFPEELFDATAGWLRARCT